MSSSEIPSLLFKSTSYSSPHAGPRLLVTGAVHGNETCGTKGIRRVIEEIEAGTLSIIAGTVTFVPIANPLAYQRGERSGDRNLNRKLQPTDQPREFEDYVANWLCPLMAQHEVLLDLHSFRGEGEAFVMVGPENNDGAIEPFHFAAEEKAMALRLGVSRFVDGWLSTYARGVERRKQYLASLSGKADAAQLLNADPLFGVGTTEYMRSVGGYAMTLECGQHQDPHAPEVAYRAIINTLAHLGLIAGGDPAPVRDMEALRIYDVVDKTHRDDSFSRAWSSFDVLKKGDLIGTRHDGTPVVAEIDGRIIFPDANAQAGEEWFYLTKANARLQDIS
ncbi:succinylglutamate desuccinylase/aspartoacylase family protein [Undibacterium terreum]|uniref:Succinylglutamate desuccinylase n=1 Tax=Undibacterium terreum TaxID=1224302 RepID=A0A916U5W4_9BURK|nr:succinylglutamate desuccinylase/aspartoacylase family protein [Undibacterium terreum]GGC61037.1 succinylglutamate desuccinylase [Undibacterium terreum]